MSGSSGQRSNGNRQEVLLRHISDFTDWGGRAWASLCRDAFTRLGTLENKRVLEIGFRFGKMTSLFALMGAHVTGLETDSSVISRAQEEVDRHGVGSRVSLVHYDGQLSHCDAVSGRQFDVVFSKSVLVLLGNELRRYLQSVEGLLAEDGRCVFVENGYGGRVFALMRALRRHQQRDGVDYFTQSQLDVIAEVFTITRIRRSYFPPIYLVMAAKKRS